MMLTRLAGWLGLCDCETAPHGRSTRVHPTLHLSLPPSSSSPPSTTPSCLLSLLVTTSIFSRIMTSTSPQPPDISSLSISPNQSRLHDPAYDFDALQRQQQHQFGFSGSPGGPGQMQFNPLGGMGQSPLKNKPIARAGLPSVRPSVSLSMPLPHLIIFVATPSNGLTTKSSTTGAPCHRPPIRISPQVVLRLCTTSRCRRTCPHRPSAGERMTRSYPPP